MMKAALFDNPHSGQSSLRPRLGDPFPLNGRGTGVFADERQSGTAFEIGADGGFSPVIREAFRLVLDQSMAFRTLAV